PAPDLPPSRSLLEGQPDDDASRQETLGDRQRPEFRRGHIGPGAVVHHCACADVGCSAPNAPRRPDRVTGSFAALHMSLLALSHPGLAGRARPLCPGTSDINFLGNLNCIVDLNAQVADGALDLSVSEQKLDSTKIDGSAVDQGRLGPPERVGAELQTLKA